jgi:hypothetical protein
MKILVGVCAIVLWAVSGLAQMPSPVPSIPIQMVPSYYALIPISATGAVSTQVTLTIPAPAPGLYNYICTVGLNYSQTTTTGTAQTNAVTTSTNFNSFALKFSVPQAVNTNYDWMEIWGDPASGCPKSTSSATSTTFVSPAAAAQGMWTWYAVYYQGP